MRIKTQNSVITFGVFLFISASAILLPATPIALGDESEFDLCDADLNADGFVNMVDIVMFADDFYSPGVQARSDFNNDGAIDLSDVILFVTALGAGEC